MKENLRIIISGGGTGGHIFPAVSIANAIKELHPETEILFVGAEGRMEMSQDSTARTYSRTSQYLSSFSKANVWHGRLSRISIHTQLLV